MAEDTSTTITGSAEQRSTHAASRTGTPDFSGGAPLRVLLVNAGPHRNGCTNRALAEVAGALQAEGIETETFWVGTKPIASCIGCKKCAELGRCVFDDRVNEFVEIAPDFDGYVLGTPVHFGSATGAATAFFDRSFYVLRQSVGDAAFRMKPGAAVASCRRAGNTATIDQINRYFQLLQMPIVTSRYWNIVHGATAEEVERDEEGLQAMRFLGGNMAYLLKALRLARKSGLELPQQEQTVYTNFIRHE
jgi:multimeric flavodoxin WrbA